MPSDATHIRKLQKKHKLNAELIESLPGRYNDPAAVFRDKPSAYVAITDLMARTDDGKMKPVMARFHQKRGRNGEYIFLASAYPRESVQEKI